MKIPSDQQFGRALLIIVPYVYHNNWSTITLRSRLRMSWSDKENNAVVCYKGVVNCPNSRDKGPPECNSARG